MNRFSYLLQLLKRFKDKFGTCKFPRESHPVPYFVDKFNFLESSKTAEKPEASKHFNKWASGCTQYLRDQSISFMTDLRKDFKLSESVPVTDEKSRRYKEYERYEACRDTISQFMNKIKIVEKASTGDQTTAAASVAATSEAVDTGIETAILQR